MVLEKNVAYEAILSCFSALCSIQGTRQATSNCT